VKGSGNHDEVNNTEDGEPVRRNKPVNIYQWSSMISFIRADAELEKEGRLATYKNRNNKDKYN
jgi:hypothetical protein